MKRPLFHFKKCHLWFINFVLQQAAFGGNTSAGGGPTFADVLHSSYGLTLNEFGGGDGHGGADPDEGGGGGGGATTPVPHHHSHHHHGSSAHMSHMSGHQCTESHTYRHNGGGGAGRATSLYHLPGHHGSGSPFSEALDTFHAEFITQPIDYPLSNVSPPPPLSLPPHPQSAGNASDSTGSPVSSSQQQQQAGQPTHPPHPPMSPSLPSFLDTYRHPSGPHEMSPQHQVIKIDFTRTLYMRMIFILLMKFTGSFYNSIMWEKFK